jgi:chemotaxis protein methyltransferase CheR
VISRRDYLTLKEILLAHSGHFLGDGKEYLVVRRLESVPGVLGHPDLAALVRHLRLTQDPRAVKLVCEAMTTNESLFFRDGRPFELLRDRVLPDLMEKRQARRRLRIWSSACSTGQEPYSLAMLVADTPELAGWKVDILATDYSPRVVERAREGTFNQFEIHRGLDEAHLARHFEALDGGRWRVNEALRRTVAFKEANLLRGYRELGTFDLVLCRNVLIYFDQTGKKAVLDRMAEVIPEDGFLLLGASETAAGVSSRWQVVPDSGTTLLQRT